jgi:hypothetical protein
MNRHLSYAITFALSIFTAGLSAETVTLQTISYNFSLDGNGGGAQAKLNGAPVEVFCDNFGNNIAVPTTYTANLTDLSTTANLDQTRFGGVTSGDWVTINLTGGDSTAAQDDTFFNSGAGSSALARYEMAAYLVSLYDVPLGANAANSNIQSAIWALMDPTANSSSINANKVTGDLEAAASWYMSMNAGNLNALNAFLNGFGIISSPKMTFSNGLGVGGFQEQIVRLPMAPTPEPRAGIFALLGLFIGGGFLWRRSHRTASGVHAAS